MIQSLDRASPGFSLHVLCMDDVTHDLLQSLAITGLKLIRLTDFEDEDLLQVKPARSRAEYCWTCTPCILDFVLKRDTSIELLTYLDADLMFFSSPEPIFDEIGAGSVAIIEHRFSAGFEHYAVNGKYNVEWVSIRRDASGLETVTWWRERCLEWCSAVSDGERMGDQKYLDCWPTKFTNVRVIGHAGAGVAPWNFATHQFSEQRRAVYVDSLPVIFYHYHGYRMLEDGGFTPMPQIYMETTAIPYLLYEPYRIALWQSLGRIREQVPNFICGLYETSPLVSQTVVSGIDPVQRSVAQRILRRLRRMLNCV